MESVLGVVLGVVVGAVVVFGVLWMLRQMRKPKV